MKVKELIEKLKKVDPEGLVGCTYSEYKQTFGSASPITAAIHYEGKGVVFIVDDDSVLSDHIVEGVAL